MLHDPLALAATDPPTWLAPIVTVIPDSLGPKPPPLRVTEVPTIPLVLLIVKVVTTSTLKLTAGDTLLSESLAVTV